MKPTTMEGQPLLMMGAGGHAKVLQALALAAGRNIIGVCDPHLALRAQTHWRGIPVIGGDEALQRVDPAIIGLINGVGQLVGNHGRQHVYLRQRQAGFGFPTLVHPSAWVAPSAVLEQGVQVMAGVVIQPDCHIGENTIINTRASVDHDCEIGAHVHIAPGAILCGGVRVKIGAFVGSGAILIQGLVVGDGATVGAGVTLTKNLDRDEIVLGPEPRHKARTAE